MNGKAVEELSEEDQALKEGLELAVNRLREADDSLHKQALDHLVSEIRSSTSSMTSVPKPLKFLKPHYDSLKAVYEGWPESHSMKTNMADMLSVLAMTMAIPGSRECLKFKLQGTQVNISSWGHEYVRSLAGEISEEYNHRSVLVDNKEEEDDWGLDGEPVLAVNDLMVLVDDLVPFQMQHNAEADAVDLLIEVKQLPKLLSLTPSVVDERNYERVCLYLLRSADYMSDSDELASLYHTAYLLYKGQGKITDALRVALKMDASSELIDELFSSCNSLGVKKQLCLLLGRHRSPHRVSDSEGDDQELLNELVGNCHLSEQFLGVAREMDALTPKLPEDIYKTSATPAAAQAGLGAFLSGVGNNGIDSARANLASTFVNAFINAGFCKDKLIIAPESSSGDSNSWLYKNKGHGMMSAAASLGMLMLWNVDEGLNQMDKYFHNTEDFVKAGACLGVGMVSCGVRNEADPALALLSDYLTGSSPASSSVRTASVCGLGIAYAGTGHPEVQGLLEGVVGTDTGDFIEVCMAALALGMTFVGTCDDDVGTAILSRMMEATETDLNQSCARFLCLGLGLVYLCRGERAEVVLEAVKSIKHLRGRYCEAVLETCAYAGTGNVLKVQQMLRMCTEHLTENCEHQAVAVLGLALVTVGEDIGSEMTLRTFEHLLHYGELPVKRVVPLALALLYVSNPEYSVIDQLSRLSHDQDPEIAMCAIFGLGLVSAGSNNSRVAGLLRSLAEFYGKEANHQFVVRIAQGLNAMGKGLLTLTPFHSDRLLLNGPGLAGLLVVLHAFIDVKGTILDKFHYLLFFLSVSMNPRYLCTVDQDLKPITASVRVGQAVETVGQAGRPKTITGFQTHTTPVLLGYKDRAELAGGEYISLGMSIMEGVVIVEKVASKDVV